MAKNKEAVAQRDDKRSRSVKSLKTTKSKSSLLTVLSIGILIVGATVFSLALLANQSSRENNNQTKKTIADMQSYLEKKYGQSFAVGDLQKEGSGFTVEGSLVAYAHPANDPTLIFKLRKPEHSTAPDYYDYDSFLATLWSKQARMEVDKLITEQLPNVGNYLLTIRPADTLVKSIDGYTPTFSEAKSKYAGQYSYTLDVASLTGNTADRPTEDELTRAFKLVNFVKMQQSNQPELIYSYNYGDRTDSPEASTGYYYQFKVRGKSQLDTINTTSDVLPLFTKAS